MELSDAERAILARYREKCRIAGGPTAGYLMRVTAIRLAAADRPGVDVEAGLQGLSDKGLLKANESGDRYYLTEDGVECLGNPL